MRLVAFLPFFVGVAAVASVFLAGRLLGWPAGVGVVSAVALWTGVAAGFWFRLSRRFEKLQNRHLNEVSATLFAHPELRPVARELARLDPAMGECAGPYSVFTVI